MNKEEIICRDCGEDADPKYTIKMGILGDDDFHYCAICGEVAKAFEEELDNVIGF